MLTFYSDPAKKQARIERAKKHIAQDRLMSGCYQYGESNRGCSVGCDAIDISGSADVDCHAIVAKHDGTPEWLEYLRDAIFEGLPQESRSDWHLQLAEAIPVGVDIEAVRHQFLDWLLSPEGPMGDIVIESAVREVISEVRKIHQMKAQGKDVEEVIMLSHRAIVYGAFQNSMDGTQKAHMYWAAYWTTIQSCKSIAEAARAASVLNGGWQLIATKVIGLLRTDPFTGQ